VVQVIIALMGRSDTPAQSQNPGSLPAVAMLSRARAPLDTSFRDPFQSYLYAQKPAPAPVVAARPVAVQKTVEPPTAMLSGILWGDEPVAILKRDGATELVKKGAEVWDLKVIRVDRDQVIVQKQGRQFTLGY
jgi:hypothetical protein